MNTWSPYLWLQSTVRKTCSLLTAAVKGPPLCALCVTAVELFDVTQGHGELWLTCTTTASATEGSVLAAPPSLRTSDGDQSFMSSLPRDSLTWAGNLIDWAQERWRDFLKCAPLTKQPHCTRHSQERWTYKNTWKREKLEYDQMFLHMLLSFS